MTIIDLVRLLRKHRILLLFTPILLAGLVVYLTRNPKYTFSSETTLYTGLASGSSVEMGKSLSYSATTTDFDNLINVINSRETQQEVAIRLLAQHLMLPNADQRYISEENFDYLKKITPLYVRSLVAKSNDLNENKINQTIETGAQLAEVADTAKKDTSVVKIDPRDTISVFSFANLYPSSKNSKTFPASIDESAFEQTVKNLTDLAAGNDTNFVSQLIHYDNPHYSIEALSSINAQRIGSSDLVKLKYSSDDPGICQQTLIFLTEVCIKNYKVLKENRSDAVVKYFEYQVNQATQKLKTGEERLLSFNKDNNIINYYEQSKAVAQAKEALDVDYNNMRIKLAGLEASIKSIETKLENQQKIQLKSAPILEKRNQLSQINTRIATAETIGHENTSDSRNLPSLKVKADQLKGEIRELVGELYRFGNSTEGLPISTLLNEWITNVVNFEDTKAGLRVLAKRVQDFQKQYQIFAPAGANLKKIEREISVSEQEFLELLHGLNQAKLKMQDLELSSNLKVIDQPFYPVTANPSKRKFLVIGAALFGFLIVLSTILALEFFDETLKNPRKAGKILDLFSLGVFPKIFLKSGLLNFPFVTQRLLEMMVQHIERSKKEKDRTDEPYKILIFSTLKKEGKNIIAQNLASQLKKHGNRVMILRYTEENSQNQKSDGDYSARSLITPEEQKNPSNRFSLINWLLGYPDNRIDYHSPFLSEKEFDLSKNEYCSYTIKDDFLSINDVNELFVRNKIPSAPDTDYILIEIPPILYYPYPLGLVASVDLPLLVCRANRDWSQADRGALENISQITSRTPWFVLNGVELEVVESILGKLPKKRSFL